MKRKRRIVLLGAAALTAAEAVAVGKRRGSWLGARTIVRCRRGHLFTTIWIPGASVKSLRLGLWRLQRCPVCERWSLVTPMNVGVLSDEERELAQSRRDTRLP